MRGIKVTCSDLDKPLSYLPAKKIFGEFEFIKLNIIEDTIIK